MDIAHQSQPTTGLDTRHFIRIGEHKKSQTKGPRCFGFLIFYNAHYKLQQLYIDISPEQNSTSCFWAVVLGTPEALKGVIKVCKG